MKSKIIISSALALTLALTPVSNANAYDHYHSHYHHGGHDGGAVFGLFALGAAVVGAAALIATAPIRAVADAAPPAYDNYGGGYAQEPQQQAYYAPPPRQYYAPAPAYAYYPQPVYYTRGYYRY